MIARLLAVFFRLDQTSCNKALRSSPGDLSNGHSCLARFAPLYMAVRANCGGEMWRHTWSMYTLLVLLFS